MHGETAAYWIRGIIAENIKAARESDPDKQLLIPEDEWPNAARLSPVAPSAGLGPQADGALIGRGELAIFLAG